MAFVEVQPIPEPYAGKILTTKTIVIGNLLTLLPLLLMLGGGGLAYVAVVVFLPVDGNNVTPTEVAVGVILAVVGTVVAAASAYWGLRNATRVGNWYLRRLARREIGDRPDGLVNPEDPTAIFVEVVPRQNWGRLMLETATDVGFLLVDEERREVRFEGDRERFRIPAAAILSCEVEETTFGEGTEGAIRYYLTVIQADEPSGVWEVPLAYRGDFGQLGARTREERALALRDRILSLIP